MEEFSLSGYNPDTFSTLDPSDQLILFFEAFSQTTQPEGNFQTWAPIWFCAFYILWVWENPDAVKYVSPSTSNENTDTDSSEQPVRMQPDQLANGFHLWYSEKHPAYAPPDSLLSLVTYELLEQLVTFCKKVKKAGYSDSPLLINVELLEVVFSSVTQSK